MRATPTPLLREAVFGLGWQLSPPKPPLEDGVSPVLTMILMQRPTSSKLMFSLCASPWGACVSVCEHAAFYHSAHTCGCFHFLLAGDKLGALPRERWSPREPPACLPDLQLEPGSKSRSSPRLAPGQPAHGCGASGLLSLPSPFLPAFPSATLTPFLREALGSQSPAISVPRAYLWLSAQRLGLELREGRVLNHCERTSATGFLSLFPALSTVVFILLCFGTRVVRSEKRPELCNHSCMALCVPVSWEF